MRTRRRATVLDSVRTEGALKLLFPEGRDPFEAVLINTSGGLTGGDRQSLDLTVGSGANMTLTTQAAERVYRAAEGVARVSTRIAVDKGARLNWLPQELILFDGAALDRRLTCDLADGASLSLVEPLVFGRRLMGESLARLTLSDSVRITRAGRPLYRDRIRFSGDFALHADRAAIASGAGAMASVVCVRPDAMDRLALVRRMLPPRAGASLLSEDTLVIRLLAEDSFTLRRHLIPILETLGGALPKTWRL